VPPPQPPPAIPASPAKPPRKFPVWVIAVVVVGALIMCGVAVGGIALLSTNKPYVPATAYIYPTNPPYANPTSAYINPTSAYSYPTVTVGVVNRTPTPYRTSTPAAGATWEPCSGAYPSRLHVGDEATVSYDPPLANRLREGPSTSYNILELIEPGEHITILDGPSCGSNEIWWRVRRHATGTIGWTLEGDYAGYWLVRVP
jgi:hypothetical protein